MCHCVMAVLSHRSFYRATFCVSAVFAVARCLSVRLSDTLVDCIQSAEDIVKLLSRPGSPITLVFFNPERRYLIPAVAEFLYL